MTTSQLITSNVYAMMGARQRMVQLERVREDGPIGLGAVCPH
jgi:hypothetical protein